MAPDSLTQTLLINAGYQTFFFAHIKRKKNIFCTINGLQINTSYNSTHLNPHTHPVALILLLLSSHVIFLWELLDPNPRNLQNSCLLEQNSSEYCMSKKLKTMAVLWPLFGAVNTLSQNCKPWQLYVKFSEFKKGAI